MKIVLAVPAAADKVRLSERLTDETIFEVALTSLLMDRATVVDTLL